MERKFVAFGVLALSVLAMLVLGENLANVSSSSSAFADEKSADKDEEFDRVDDFYKRSQRLLSSDHNNEFFSKYSEGLQKFEGEIFDITFLKSLSPVPRNCVPVTGRAPFYVLSKTDLLVVRRQEADDYKRFFVLKGFILLDTDGSGIPEAYGFGWERLPNGAALVSEDTAGQTENTGAELAENFANGLTIIPWKTPTLFIDMSEWNCRSTHYPNGDIEAR